MALAGSTFRDALISASNNIRNFKKDIDELNIFPVPDGDTGTNMSMTAANAAKELANVTSNDISEVAKIASSAFLRGARGNSGVILSLLFRGFSKSVSGKKEITAPEMVAAFSKGVEAAYKAVMKPTEGTILTVARVSAEKAGVFAQDNDDISAVFGYMLDIATETLEQTPEMLPVLKKAGVVDSGGAGYVKILEGMFSVIRDGVMIGLSEESDAPSKAAAANVEIYSNFMYCTEFIINKKEDAAFDARSFRAFLESVGDSAVLVEDDDIVKCHVHTNDPGEVLTRALKNGLLSNMKIENMFEQHLKLKKNSAPSAQEKPEEFEYAAPDPQIAFGFVAVAAGKGLRDLFTELGAGAVVCGGQTMNPSTDDILKAIQSVPAQTIFVLPNNKNIIMAAEQAIRLADRKVYVLPTRTVPQGISALLAFDDSATAEKNAIEMSKAIETVSTGTVTFAAHDADFDGHKIKKGDLMAMENGKLTFIDDDLEDICVKLARSMVKKSSSLLTLYYGSAVSGETAAQIEESIRKKIPDTVEINTVNGGQPVYYFIISAE